MSTEYDSQAALAFLRRFHPDDLWVLTAIQLEPKTTETATFAPDESAKCLEWIERHNGRRNLYFHVNPPMGRLTKKAERADIKAVTYLHCDVDPRAGENLEAEQDRCLVLLTQKLPNGVALPTIVTFSGGGYQAFWRLENPIVIDGEIEAADRAAAYNITLAHALGGDNCHDVSRLMRLPGTLNLPDKGKLKKGRVPTAAKVIVIDDQRVYPLSAFTPADAKRSTSSVGQALKRLATNEEVARFKSVDELDDWAVSDRVKIAIVQGRDPDNPKKGDNSRSAWVFDVACHLVRAQVPDERIYAILTDPSFGISESVLENAHPERYAVRQIERAREMAIDPSLLEMNDRHAVVMNYGGHTQILTEGDRPLFQTPRELQLRYLNRTVELGSEKGPVIKPLADWWLRCPERREYEAVEFAPGLTLPLDIYNMWRGFRVKRVPGTCDKFLGLVHEIIANGNSGHGNWLLDFMAHAVQRPWEPAEVAVVLRGGQGLGKSFFVERFGELFAPHFVPITDPKHVVGNFNRVLHDALVVFADEAFAAQDKRCEGILKGLVTQTHITIEPKGVDAFKAKKFFRLFLASNQSWVVPADVDDRRFLVLDVSKAKQYQRL